MPDAAPQREVHKPPRHTFESYSFQCTERMSYKTRPPGGVNEYMQRGSRRVYSNSNPALDRIPEHRESARPPSAKKAETISAFSELNLARSDMKQYRTTELREPYKPATARDNYEARRGNVNESLDSTVHFNRDGPLLDNGHAGRTTGVYRPTTTRSEVSVASTKKSYGKLTEVYSNSGDTVEFAHNFGSYLTSIIPPFAWIALFAILGLWGMVLILVGAFNLPFCALQPMIPIYLIVTGSLFILLAAIRVYSLWPMPEGTRPTSLGTNLACRAIEGLIVVAIFVWLILGCIWVYGRRNQVHFREGLFERHYCDPGTYWIAFVAVTLHLVLLALAIIIGIVVVAMGIYKESSAERGVEQP